MVPSAIARSVRLEQQHGIHDNGVGRKNQGHQKHDCKPPPGGDRKSRSRSHKRERQKPIFTLPRERTAGNGKRGHVYERGDRAEHHADMHFKRASEGSVRSRNSRQQHVRGRHRCKEHPQRLPSPQSAPRYGKCSPHSSSFRKFSRSSKYSSSA